ncbi:hypothetical protein DEU56DRAFT_922877 [Suillus clintonianus]|uniref:uncharacterized protein n=1 Tax=Suillus clintonianus TaxID=1904413 RepID=UPI001B864895|nr:uncharacterized protein DEU56DRAFT_922877 [Suillus clintonianus]KAG2150464.1 hypothetical protein DEU56DRAFT_922877 [Suillus clintonianus]
MEPTSQLGASTSLPQLNNLKGPQLLSGSGSFQSYLSSAGSYHRHAKGAGVHLENQYSVHIDKNQSPHLQSIVEASSHSGPFSGVVRFITNFPGFALEDLHRFRYGHLGRLRILLLLYCCVSVTFLSFKMHSALRGVVAAGRPHIGHVPNTMYRVSPLSNMSVQQRMSIAFPNIPPPGHLETFTLATHSSVDSDLTACLWTEEDKLRDILTTLTTWPGPVSLVVVTSARSDSTDHLTTFKRFPEFMGLLDTHASFGLSFHVLQVSSSSGGSANAYLNVARLLAPTDRVVLFPNGLPSHLSNNLYSSIIRSTSPLPLVLGNNSRRTYPFAPMSPVILPKDYPTWCTERFSLFRSRSLDWEDCLWQLWLESAGSVKSTAVDGWLGEETGKPSISNNSALSAKLRRRWTVKYRAEACALAMKRAQILEITSYADKKAFQWRKKFCHESLGTSPANAA